MNDNVNKNRLKYYKTYIVLYSYLLTQFNWSGQAEITRETGLSGVQVRRIMQHYPAGFVSSRSGYKLAMMSNRQEIQECVSGLIRRSNKMLARADALSGRMVYL